MVLAPLPTPVCLKILRCGLLLALLPGGLCLSTPLQAQSPTAGAEPWPFGKAGRFSSGRDLWNLGLLGAKAWDGARALPKPPGPGRRSRQTGRPGQKEKSPVQLKVILLFPGGPAEKGGLKRGDIILGVGRSRFQKGFRLPLAKALLQAEAGRARGKLTLLVKRTGQKRPLHLQIKLPVRGRALLKPERGRGRQIILEEALDWLGKQQLSSGGFKETLSGRGGAVVQTSLAGLAWLAGGARPDQGRYSKNLAQAWTFVEQNLFRPEHFIQQRKPGGPSWDQSNWPLAYAGLFVGTLQARHPSASRKQFLQRIADQLQKNQIPSGGWAHGTGGKNALGYLELNIVTGLALYALGMARENGCKVNERVILGARRYIKESSSGGGVGYSANPGQRGQGNIGRSAAVWLGYRLLGLAKKQDTQLIGKYVKRNVTRVLGGHASLMQHLLLAGLAAAALGHDADQEFWKSVRTDLVLARAPDGSLQPRPWHETLNMGSNTDVSFGEVWTTSCWAIILGARTAKGLRPGLPELTRIKATH